MRSCRDVRSDRHHLQPKSSKRKSDSGAWLWPKVCLRPLKLSSSLTPKNIVCLAAKAKSDKAIAYELSTPLRKFANVIACNRSLTVAARKRAKPSRDRD